MKMRITYNSPTGYEEDSPSDAFVSQLFESGEEYWQDIHGCGHGVFCSWENGIRIGDMEVTFKEGHGFHLRHWTDMSKVPGQPTVFLAFDKRIRDGEVVTLHYGGEPFLVPAALFVSKDLAVRAAREFCENAGRTNDVNWIPKKGLNWNSETGQWHPSVEIWK